MAIGRPVKEGAPLRVLFIGGSGRSGSTIIARLLGQIEGMANVGEASRYLFDLEMQARDIPCSCGRPVGACPYWKETAAGIPDEERQLVTERVRIRNLPWLARQHSSGDTREKLSAAMSSLRSALESVREREGGAVIVDSSKNPATGFFLSSVNGVELSVLHLVRDPRAVVSSWTRAKGYLRSHSVLKVTSWWISHNLGCESLRRRTRRFLRLRFEDFLDRPKESITTIGGMAIGSPPDMSFWGRQGAVVDGEHHVLAGNPDKFAGGVIAIRARPWQLPVLSRAMVTLMCSPLMVRYGYISAKV